MSNITPEEKVKLEELFTKFRLSVRQELKAEINKHAEEFIHYNPDLPASALLQHLRIVVL